MVQIHKAWPTPTCSIASTTRSRVGPVRASRHRRSAGSRRRTPRQRLRPGGTSCSRAHARAPSSHGPVSTGSPGSASVEHPESSTASPGTGSHRTPSSRETTARPFAGPLAFLSDAMTGGAAAEDLLAVVRSTGRGVIVGATSAGSPGEALVVPPRRAGGPSSCRYWATRCPISARRWAAPGSRLDIAVTQSVVRTSWQGATWYGSEPSSTSQPR